MKFRYHRSTLPESLETTIEFKDKEELYNILQKDLSHWKVDFNIDDIKCKFYCYDERCDWNVHLITLKEFGVLGMTDAQI